MADVAPERIKGVVEEAKQYFAPDLFTRWEWKGPTSLDDIWTQNDYLPGCEEGRWTVGLYFILGENGELLYVGKASNGSSVGIRLATYFKKDETADGGWGLSSSGAKLMNKTGIRPAEILVYVCEDYDQAWLAPALEEYCIWKLTPPANTVGRRDQWPANA